MFLPTTPKEVKARGWDRPDIILVTGDTYIDSPFMGVCVIGKVLTANGFKVGIIAQPDLDSANDIKRLGEPALFWGITGGSIDSMIANYTPLKKRRKSDDYTPGGQNNRRPDRAVIAYANLVRRHFKNTKPIVLGGIEASLRRIAHFDFWSNAIRRSILFDAKADYLLFGMAHQSVLDLALALKHGDPTDRIPGLAWICNTAIGRELPDFEQVKKSPDKYIKSVELFYQNTDPVTAQTLCQKHNDRYVILNPPASLGSSADIDAVHDLSYERDVHPYYRHFGSVRALDTIRFAIPIHYGCYGECHFCAITVHQGRTVQYRSEASIVDEARQISKLPGFKGYITDLGGPTANMYGFECKKKITKGICSDKRCLFPTVCRSLKPDHSPLIRLIKKIEALPGIKKVFISSGIRYDMILADTRSGRLFLKKITADNVSGQMKIAPEHTQPRILTLMGKQNNRHLLEFKELFDRMSRESGKKQFLTYYMIAAHPGCTADDMAALKQFASQKLKTSPEQVQIFTPSPSTWSTLMYHTCIDPFTGEQIFVEKDPRKKELQKRIVTQKKSFPKQSAKKLLHKKRQHRRR